MNEEQLQRYGRHISLSQLGEAGQQKLLDSTALIVGMGGLGSPIALYLAAAGVGKLILADFDQVELSNLQRQIAHGQDSLGRLKTHSGRDACLRLNPTIEIETIDYALDDEDAGEAVAQADVVLDASDNFPTRFALNAACVKHGKPLVSGAAIRFDGQISVYHGSEADQPCYQCLYKDGNETAADSCSLTGVFSPVVGLVGTVQAMEALKILSGIGETLKSRLLLLDGLNMQWQEIQLVKDPACPVCS
ncbi:HesA/MoeB/ThiF family protein [Granulosicoccaceae sp. 1_MG-2023]|nr:HesA/MoeB/ThiF family protein [Granulosicoccaceae sp. 1_MG-2023]